MQNMQLVIYYLYVLQYVLIHLLSSVTVINDEATRIVSAGKRKIGLGRTYSTGDTLILEPGRPGKKEIMTHNNSSCKQ